MRKIFRLLTVTKYSDLHVIGIRKSDTAKGWKRFQWKCHSTGPINSLAWASGLAWACPGAPAHPQAGPRASLQSTWIGSLWLNWPCLPLRPQDIQIVKRANGALAVNILELMEILNLPVSKKERLLSAKEQNYDKNLRPALQKWFNQNLPHAK